MSRTKVHKISEALAAKYHNWHSVIDGLCGAKQVERVTPNWDKVTCKKCLKLKEKPTNPSIPD